LKDIGEFDGVVDTWELFPREGDPTELDVPDER